MPELHGHLTPTGTLGGSLNTIVYASNYNVLSNKPQINNVELTGNKTAEDLGLAVPSDITVYSVNEKTGDVELTGADIEYTSGVSLNAKIIDIESQIATSGVLSVNGETGIVSLDANDIPYSTGVSTKAKIDAVEQSIPVVDYPVTSVNGETGAVVLDGTDIEYSSGVTINSKINAVEQSIPVVDYPVTSVNGQTGDVTISVPTNAGELPLGTTTPTGSTAEAIGNIGTELTASWTANSTSAYGTALTDSITVTKGTWVISWGHPVQSGDIACFVNGITTNSDITEQFMTMDTGTQLTKGVIIAKFTGNASLNIASGGSASVTFTNTTRGFLRAVKVSA